MENQPSHPRTWNKRVIAINGSSRKVTTQKLLDEIAAALAAQQIDVTVISLAGREIGDCIGCELCIRKTSECYQQDEAKEILPQLLDADGIILASPVYVMNITGKLKSLIDKTASWIHRPPLVGKPALLVATTAGSGLKDTLGYLELVAIQWGAHPAGKIGRTAMDQSPVSAKELRSFVWHLDHETRQYRPSMRQLIYYQVQKVLALKVLALDREYWTARGWDTGYYYYPCRAPWYKRLLGEITYRVLNWRIRPVEFRPELKTPG
jgi:multimeric flavodoxin WrbA